MTLFDDDALTGVPSADRDTFALISAYAGELLADPPIGAVSMDNADRDRNARKFAAKDVLRFLRAAEKAGYEIRKT